MKIKANILLITLFLLMMSSLSALLVTAYIRNLIKSSAVFYNYYKTYYVANAWLELALVKTNGQVRGYGFEDEVKSSSKTVTDNFSWLNTYFTTSIKTSSLSLWEKNISDTVTTCNADNITQIWYELPPGWCVPIILLQDNDNRLFSGGEGSIKKISATELHVVWNDIWNHPWPKPIIYATQDFTLLLTKVNADLSFNNGRSTWFKINESSMIPDWGIWRTPGDDVIKILNPTGTSISSDSDRYILMIANTSASMTGYYCVQSVNPIPSQYVTISAQWRFSNITLDLKWVRKAWLPADFCYTAISN